MVFKTNFTTFDLLFSLNSYSIATFLSIIITFTITINDITVVTNTIIIVIAITSIVDAFGTAVHIHIIVTIRIVFIFISVAISNTTNPIRNSNLHLYKSRQASCKFLADYCNTFNSG